MKPKKFPFSEFKKIYSKVPRFCVEVVVKTKDGVLLTKRSFPPQIGYWYLPGGTVLKGERIEQTVKRVAMEELGLKVEPGKALGVMEFLSVKNYFGHSISVAYLCKSLSDLNKIKLDDKANDFGFFNELPLNTTLDHKNFLVKNIGIKLSNKKV